MCVCDGHKCRIDPAARIHGLDLGNGNVHWSILGRILSLRLGYCDGDWRRCVDACGVDRLCDLDGRDSRSNGKRSGLCDGGDGRVRMRMRADGGGLGDGGDARSNSQGGGFGNGCLWAGARLTERVPLCRSPCFGWKGCGKKEKKTGC